MRGFSVLLLALLTACASPGTPESVRPVAETIRLNGGAAGSLTINPSSSTAYHTLPYAVDQVWRVLPTVLESMGMTIGVLDPATHEAGNAGYKLRRQLGGDRKIVKRNCHLAPDSLPGERLHCDEQQDGRMPHGPTSATQVEDRGHFAVFMKSDAFLTELVRLVSPLVQWP